ncbi:MAG TPA: hypothetical protein PKW30_06895, partial [Campylobacterales bacterium]|nr:hypothetical protein [Campylobacterales bacterium]
MHNLLLTLLLLLLTFGGCAAKLTHDDLPLKNPQKGGVIYFLPTDGYGEIYQEKNNALVKIASIGIIDGRLTYSYAKAESGVYTFAINPQKGGVNTKTFIVKDGDVIVLELK